MPITDPVPSVFSTDHHRSSSSPPYTLQSSSDPVTVLSTVYSPLQTQCQSSVVSTVHYKSSTSPPYNIMSSSAPFQFFVSSVVQHRPTTSQQYTLQSTTDPVLVLRIRRSPAQIQCQSSIYYTVHDKHSIIPPYNIHSTLDPEPILYSYTLQSSTDPGIALHILYSPPQTRDQSFVYSVVQHRPTSSQQYTL